jgi:PAS domain S-box-containing protein
LENAFAGVKSSEFHFQNEMDAISVAIWCAAPDGAAEFQNQTWREYTGLSAEASREQGWLDAIHPEDMAHYAMKWREIRAAQAPGAVEVRLRRFDGVYRWFSVRVVPVRNERGNIIGWCGTNIDIDDHKQAQALLALEKRVLDIIAKEDPRPSFLNALSRLVEENENLREDFRDLFEEAPIPYVHEGLDSRFIRANRAAMRVLGIGPDEIAGTFGSSLVANTPETQRRLREAFESIAEGKETSEVELELRRKDNGNPVWVHWWSKPAPSGRFTRTMMVDITDRVLMAQTKAALEFSLESGQVGDWDLDLVHDTSRRSLRHDQCFGYNHPIPEAEWGVEEFIRHVHPEDRVRVESSMREAVKDSQDWVSEFRVVWPDGSVHWLIACGRIYRIEEGRPVRMLGIVMDITERKKTEEALRETKAELEFALESAQIGDWDLDLVTDTSRRSLRHDQCFGYNQAIPEAEWGIEAFIRHVHPEDRVRVEGSLRRAAKDLLDWGSEFRVVWPDGNVHWLAARGSIYRTREGKAIRMLGIVMDISDRKRAEEALGASEQMARGQVEALKHTLDALAMDSAPDRLAQHISRTITEQLGAHSSSVWRRNESNGLIGFEFAFEGGNFVTKSDSTIAGLSLWLPMDDSWPWPAALHAGAHCLMEDIRKVPSFPLRDRLVAMGIITVLMVPMLIAGRLEGTIAIRFSHRRVFRNEEIELAQTLANQAVLAMQLTRLSAENRDSAVIAERNRMARDIHDSLAQGFTGVIVQLEAAEDAKLRGLSKEADEHLNRAGDLARDSLNEARRSVQALRPLVLEENDLCGALSALFAKMTTGTSLRSEFKLQGHPRPLPPAWEENLLYIGQEALTNVLRHARANHFSAQLAFSSDALRLDLRDDGCGFDPSSKNSGFGLLGMRERVESIGGQLAVVSAPGEGTAVLITVPLAGGLRASGS